MDTYVYEKYKLTLLFTLPRSIITPVIIFMSYYRVSAHKPGSHLVSEAHYM
jgi:hypothetical protein